MFNKLKLVNRFAAINTNTTTAPTSLYTLRSTMINGATAAAYFHTNIIGKNHFVITEEKKEFLEALKVELFASASRLNVVNMINENSSQRSYSTQVDTSQTQVDDGFDKSLENSRNLMCHKRHDVLTQQQSEYFLYL